MSFVDSLDSVLMLYAYASPSRSTPDGKLGLFYCQKTESQETDPETRPLLDEVSHHDDDDEAALQGEYSDIPNQVMDKKSNVMSSLSITLTALSILVAIRYVSNHSQREWYLAKFLSISVIEIMSMIGENCKSCSEAAEADDGGGFTGAWWRAWAKVSEHL